ncbi:TetR/AcrR family transcriptional regulator [Goodfellowiella coeruleoviolacea]|uniref:TetR/AcrR family transcriptional regulator n=1 Tax=Goodfellowiella coeruleoviolacea TaxID=334858 RepID=UPI0020A30E98|nr:TetR/AcrR family transcriptional regulator [Goodfellowiella coeruleoviolacea]
MSAASSDPHPPHGSVRPGGRTARTRAAVIEATLDELVRRGYDDLTVEAVAARSGVHKATLYRRWSTVDGLVSDALDQAAEQPWQVPDTGGLASDLRALAQQIATGFTDPDHGARPTALITAALRSDQAAAALGRFLRGRLAQATPLVHRAIDRGELPEHTDADALLRALAAPLYYRLFLTREPISADLADQAALATLAAATAGVFTTR